MPLIIIAEKETERRVLEQAFENKALEIQSYDGLSGVKNIAEGDFILAVVSTINLEEIKKQASQSPVFIILNENAEDIGDFEEVFIRPVRLGIIVEVITQLIKERALHKLLSPIQLGAIILSPNVSSISYQGQSVRLTEKELAVLIFLSKNKDTPIAKQQLLDKVWEYAGNVETHTLETHIYRLRQKLQTHLGLIDFLVTSDDGYILKF